MEQEKTKRRREGEDETYFENNKNAKKRDIVYGYGMKEVVEEKEKEKEECSQFALGVFDFPWLKDGVTSKSEDYLLGFEDNFSSSLQQEDAGGASSIHFFSKEYGLCDSTPEAHIPEAKLEDNNAWQPFDESDALELEAEDVDCIWSCLLNHPLNNNNIGLSVRLIARCGEADNGADSAFSSLDHSYVVVITDSQ